MDPRAWGVSLAVHAVVLLVLNCFFVTGSISQIVTTFISSGAEQADQELNLDAIEAEPDANEVHLETFGIAEGGSGVETLATTTGSSPRVEVQRRITREVVPPPALGGEMIELPTADVMVGAVTTKGTASTENTGSAQGAMDRLAYEIAQSLRERKTLVVWLFDASLSLKSRRDAIADRFEKVYEQLDALEINEDKALKTGVASYGATTKLITTDPVDDVKKVIKSVRNIDEEESGKENVFAAVEKVTKLWQPLCAGGKRKMLVIIVTDERGDDIDRLDPAIQFTRRHGIRCYVVGNAAPFGREKGFVTWKYPDGAVEDIAVDQGPETIAPEALNLAFWGTNGVDQSRMSSGYGPYALTRLCAETGGMYLITEDGIEGRGVKFNQEIMRNYEPDYRPVRDYQADLIKNKAKASLVEAAMRTAAESAPIPRLAFRADSDATLRQEITEAQKPAAALDYKLSEMLDILSKGEKDREKVKQPRWQASYDLAMGRVLAMRVRAFGYNTVLADMKSAPKTFQEKGSNQWRLVPSTEINSGAQVKKMATKAQAYLKRVIENHPETPWAMLAARELSEPMGWDWKEGTMNIPQVAAAKPAKKNIMLADEPNRSQPQRKAPQPRQKPQL